MKNRVVFTFILIFGILFIFGSLTAGGQQEVKKSDSIVFEILTGYEPGALSEEDAEKIHEAFREQGLRGGPELDDAVRAAGFDPEKLKELAPSPSADDRRPAHEEAPEDYDGRIFDSLFSNFDSPDFNLKSAAVEDGILLKQYSCEKKIDNIEKSIPLSWENVPGDSKSLAIVMYHYPHPENKAMANSYLLLWGIDPSVTEIAYGEALSDEWYMGRNKDGNAISYTSPCSPSAGGHEYVITIFALAEYPEDLPRENTIDVDFYSFMEAVENVEIIGKAELNFKA